MIEKILYYIKLAILAIVPIGLVFYIYQLVEPLGGIPSYFDPDYTYLMNIFSLSLGKGVMYLDHPGITTFLLGTVFLFIKVLIFPESELPLRDELLQFSEQYFRFIGTGFLVLNAMALFVLGYVFWRRKMPIHLAVFAQLLCLNCVSILARLGRITGESTAIFFCVLIGVLFTSQRFKKFFPLALGFAVITKFYYLVLFAGCFFQKNRQQVLRAISILLVFLVLASLFFWEKLTRFYAVLFKLSFFKGYYGIEQKVGAPDVSFVWQKITYFLETEKGVLAAYGITIYFSLLLVYFYHYSKNKKDAHVVLYLFSSVILGALALFKHPYQIYYVFLPVVLLPFFFYELWRLSQPRKELFHLALLPVIIAVCWSGIYIIRNLNDKISVQQQYAKETAVIERYLQEHEHCKHLLHGPVGIRQDSLWFGGELTDQIFADDLTELYPQIVFLGPVENFHKYHAVHKQVNDVYKYIDKKDCVLLVYHEHGVVRHELRKLAIFKNSVQIYGSDRAYIRLYQP